MCLAFRPPNRYPSGNQAGFDFPLPGAFSDTDATPLLCAGAIGYRSLTLAELTDVEPLGLNGFGASGYLVLKMVRHRYPRTRIRVFARREEERHSALYLGAAGAGDTEP
ncbi:MAG: hypothetical protein M0P04_05410 [Syntrophales bacterium]|nr:hypothetical protein [Syntrophales bacterium]MDD4338735.1 hypothetical protein [Syntrophales bacterium]HOG07629.1 hypothetical protein [Syntrophales bacterium]HOS77962.1 hypothetical protein [Syntrophales bacterium]HPB69871.1 hypothetical protein [Syntrophales bacterium]